MTLELIWFGVWVASFLGPLVHDAYGRRRTRRRQVFWREVATASGLQAVDDVGLAVRGRLGKLSARLGEHADGSNGFTEIEISGSRLAHRLTLRPRISSSSKEVETGDDAFDDAVGVEGPAAVALAILDARTRLEVRSLIHGPLEVEGHAPLPVTGRVDRGLLRIWVPSSGGREQLVAAVRAGLALAAHLVAPADVALRLSTNLIHEPKAAVRRRILLTLLREFPSQEATLASVQTARDDTDAEVRLRAGIALGTEGRAVLLEVAAGKKAGDKAGARAVAALGESLTLDEATALFRRACQTVRVHTARACLGAIGRHGRKAIPLLSEALVAPELADHAARALGATNDPSAEAALLRALVEGPRVVRPAAAKALGRVGTRDAVAALREAEADAELRPVARQAIAQIHSRLAGAGQGQLSIAEEQAGQLSIADDTAGRLSLGPEAGTGPLD